MHGLFLHHRRRFAGAARVIFSCADPSHPVLHDVTLETVPGRSRFGRADSPWRARECDGGCQRREFFVLSPGRAQCATDFF